MNNRLAAILPLTIICLLGAAIYLNSFNGGFQFDDMSFIVNNPSIRDLANKQDIWTSGGQPSRFVAMYSFALNYHFHELDVFGYHLTNFVIHLVTSCLVFWFIMLILSSTQHIEERYGYNKRSLAFFTALVFVSHPIQTHAVTYITQRFASLATMFYLASLCFYLKGRLIPLKNPKSLFYLFCALLAAVIGLFSKEIVVTLPLVILLLEVTVLKKEKPGLPNSISTVGMLLLLFFVPSFFSFKFSQFLVQPVLFSSWGEEISAFSQYLLGQIYLAVDYLSYLVLPVGESVYYDAPEVRSIFNPVSIAYAGTVILLLLFAIKKREKHPLVTFGIFWYFVTFFADLAPRSDLIFEHKAYLPSVGYCLILCSVIFRVFKDLKKIVFLITVIIMFFSYLTIQHNERMQSETPLWESVDDKSYMKASSNLKLGKTYFQKGQLELALIYLNKEIEISPNNYMAYNIRGLVYDRQSNNAVALENYNQALLIKENYVEALLNRGELYRKMEQYELAIADLDKALTVSPSHTDAYVYRGKVYSEMKKYNLAVANFDAALKRSADHLEAYIARGNAYRAQKKYDMALIDYNKVLEVNPRHESAYFYRSMTYNDMGVLDKALDDVLQAREYGYRVDQRYIRSLQNSIKEQDRNKQNIGF